ncbi:hypothetical protein M404DRAFT_1006029 [Pisolithus tinctorius Marx 270]|uniref:Uncharacterized protein n=1 Tax=Pisolithus tinctorius Marx 270 TaxID=870435 RepID=A0A0C3NQC8_PISTI|nr:hypothetical protein M404DRAFT_1006029 [Pisolithus tinctorius Marx 270]
MFVNLYCYNTRSGETIDNVVAYIFLTGEKSPGLCHLKDGVQGILDATWEPKPTTGMTAGSCMGSAAGQSAMGVVEGFFIEE